MNIITQQADRGPVLPGTVAHLGLRDTWHIFRRRFFERLELMPLRPIRPQNLFPTLEITASVQMPSRDRGRELHSAPFQGAKDILKDWLSKKFAGAVSSQLASDVEFTYSHNHSRELIVDMAENAWGFKATYVGENERIYVVEASIIQRPARRGRTAPRVDLHVTQNAVLAAGERQAPADFPEFVHQLAGSYAVADSSRRLTSQLQVIQTREDAEALLQFIDQSARRQPIAVFVQPNLSYVARMSDEIRGPEGVRNTQTLDEAFVGNALPLSNRLANSMGGLAHIFVIPRSSKVFDYLARSGSGVRLAPGAINIYPSGNARREFFRLEDAVQDRPGGWYGFRTQIERQLAHASLRSTTADISPLQTVLGLAKPEGGKAFDAEEAMETLLDIENFLRASASGLPQGIGSNFEAAEELAKRIENLRNLERQDKEGVFSGLYNDMQTRAEKRRHNFTAAAYGITGNYEERYETLAKWIDERFKGKVVLSSALRSALNNPRPDNYYNNVNLVYAAVELLGTLYYQQRTAEARQARFFQESYQQAIQNHYLEDKPSLVGRSSRQVRQNHTFTTEDGQAYFCDRHVGRGNSLDNRDILRIYYTWDEPRQRVVIGHMTSHLTNMATPRLT